MRRSIYERDVKKAFGRMKLEEITPSILMSVCGSIKLRFRSRLKNSSPHSDIVDSKADSTRPSVARRFQSAVLCNADGRLTRWTLQLAADLIVPPYPVQSRTRNPCRACFPCRFRPPSIQPAACTTRDLCQSLPRFRFLGRDD